MPKKKDSAILDIIADEAAALESMPMDGQLEQVAELVKQYVTALREKARLEQELKENANLLLGLTRTFLPEALMGLGMKKFVTDTGVEVKTQEVVRCRLNIPDKPAGFRWLMARGMGGIIKRKIVVVPDKEDDKQLELMEKMKKSLEKYGIDYDETEDVHAATLQAAIREEVEAQRDIERSGKKVPANRKIPDIFNLYVGQEAKVTINKKTKTELGLD